MGRRILICFKLSLRVLHKDRERNIEVSVGDSSVHGVATARLIIPFTKAPVTYLIASTRLTEAFTEVLVTCPRVSSSRCRKPVKYL